MKTELIFPVISLLAAMAVACNAEPTDPAAVVPPAADIAAATDKAEPEVTGTGEFQPKVYKADRYESLKEKSPFEFELKPEAPPPAPDPFEGLSLAGYDGSGSNLTVRLMNAATNTRITVYGEASPRKKKDESGFTVVGLNRTKNRMTTTVTLRKDGHEKEIGFDRKLFATMKAAGGAGGGGALPVIGGNQLKLGNGIVQNMPGSIIQGRAQQGGGGYQAPQAVIPGQAPAGANGGNLAGGVNSAQPINVNAGAINGMTGNAQVQINGQNIGQPQAQPEQQRRRVVLPSTTPPPVPVVPQPAPGQVPVDPPVR